MTNKRARKTVHGCRTHGQVPIPSVLGAWSIFLLAPGKRQPIGADGRFVLGLERRISVVRLRYRPCRSGVRARVWTWRRSAAPAPEADTCACWSWAPATRATCCRRWPSGTNGRTRKSTCTCTSRWSRCTPDKRSKSRWPSNRSIGSACRLKWVPTPLCPTNNTNYNFNWCKLGDVISSALLQ